MTPLPDLAQLLAANEQLVLGMLRIQFQAQAADTALRELTRFAELDELTQLPNRRALTKRLQAAISHAQHGGDGFALLFLDLDDLKFVNDSEGHHAGDELLNTTADCLSKCLRDSDTVSRYGGDEFVMLVRPCACREDAVALARDITLHLGMERYIGGQPLRIGVSIGISLYPEDGTDSSSLLKQADAAMYRAKKSKTAQPALSRNMARRLGQMREANEALVLAALSAQQSEWRIGESLRQERLTLAKVAHELRHPLMPLSLIAETLAYASQDALPEVGGIIERQIEHVKRLVDDLIDVTLAVNGKMYLVQETLDLSQLIQHVIEAWAPTIKAKGQALELQLSAIAVFIDGDPFRLTQMLYNLLGNASKFTPVAGTIGLSLTTAAGNARIVVSDDGKGISAAALPRIFEPFMQDQTALDGCNTGLGIGLTVVREVVDAHGGSVKASSAGPGQGSCFLVLLPLAAPVA
ncbi:diguanylate cyclase domain-containing protein [Pseudomonas sp. RIT-To-2]|uniref:diguanylate cyclase domain-containing protein n=1 Tax=Pseudomonas sp. RIT-To-2 TaxID=3462541 RepID=UPI002412ED60